jgi:hypothetical protein
MSQLHIQRWHIKSAKDMQATDFELWQSLVEQHHCGNMMLSALFVESLLKAFGENYYLASCYIGNSLSIMMVVKKRRSGIWGLAQLPQAESALVVGAQHISPDLTALMKALPGLVLRLDFFCLDPLDHQGVINVLAHHSLKSMHQNIRISCDGNIEDYWQQRGRKLRQNVNRYMNRLKTEDSDFEFVFTTAPEEIARAVDRYGVLESNGWKGALGTALHPRNKQGAFYQSFLTDAATNHQALVVEMFINKQLVASRLCCFNKNILIFLKTTFHEDMKQFAPGRLLLAEVIKHVMNNKISSMIDFYTHATEEQLEWATESRPMYKGSYYRYPLYLKIKTMLQKFNNRS